MCVVVGSVPLNEAVCAEKGFRFEAVGGAGRWESHVRIWAVSWNVHARVIEAGYSPYWLFLAFSALDWSFWQRVVT